MHNSIALASLLLTILVNATSAQCPKTNSRSTRTSPVQSCCQSSAKPTVVYPAHVAHCQIASCAQRFPATVQGKPTVTSYTVVQGCTAAQSRPAIQSHTGLHGHPNISYTGNTYAIQSSPGVAQTNCNCNSARDMQTFSTHSTPQAASILGHKRNPFSLAGHAREGRPPDFCAGVSRLLR